LKNGIYGMNRKKIVISSVSEKSNETNGIPHFVRNDGKLATDMVKCRIKNARRAKYS